jgi:hypothetical protein
MRILTGLDEWIVTLCDGTNLTLYADGYSVGGGEHIFSVLLTASASIQEGLDIVGRTPSDPERVMVALARIPSTAVTSVRSGDKSALSDEQLILPKASA